MDIVLLKNAYELEAVDRTLAPFEDFEKKYRKLKSEYDKLLQPLVWDIDNLDMIVGYFDLNIALYYSAYSKISNKFLSNELQIWPNRDNKSSLSLIYLLRLIMHDITTLRNLTCARFDAQFHSISRNLIEKIKIFSLCLSDIDFFDAYTGIKSMSDTQLYYQYTKPKKLDERIELIVNDYKKEDCLKAGYFMCTLLCAGSITERCSLGHVFVHTNNFKQIMSYYNEGCKFNLTPLHGSTSTDTKAYDGVCELSLLFYSFVVDALPGMIGKTTEYGIENLTPAIYKQYIKHYYNSSKNH